MSNPWIDDAQRRYAAAPRLDPRWGPALRAEAKRKAAAPVRILGAPEPSAPSAPFNRKLWEGSHGAPGVYGDTPDRQRGREKPTIAELARSTYGALGQYMPGASAVGNAIRGAGMLGVPGMGDGTFLGDQADILAPKFDPEHGAYDLIAHHAIPALAKVPGKAEEAIDYLRNTSARDIEMRLARAAGHGVMSAGRSTVRHPIDAIGHAFYTANDFVPIVGDVKQTAEGIYDAAKLRHEGLPEEAAQAESYVAPMAAVGLIPEAGAWAYKGTRNLIKKAMGHSVEDPLLYGSSPLYRPGADASGYQGPDWTGRTGPGPTRFYGPPGTTSVVNRQLALPAPGEPLPSFAVKRRGGQWMPPDVANSIPYGRAPEDVVADTFNVGRVGRYSDPGRQPGVDALTRWRDRNLLGYLKNDFGTPEDPLRSVYTDRALPGMPEESYDNMAHAAFLRSPNHHTFGELVGPDTRRAPEEVADILSGAPWMAKQPVTDPIYSLSRSSGRYLGLGDLSASLRRAVHQPSTLPSNLAVNPASLQRMSVADAFQRHHDIVDWDEAQRVAERKAAMGDNPALALHKDYPGDPKGMAWHEIVPPTEDKMFKQGYRVDTRPEEYGPTTYAALDPNGKEISQYHDHPEEAWAAAQSHLLEKELGSEGDFMGNCVGGYCEPVKRRDTRVFSLRDKEGTPHVNIETAHNQGWGDANNNYIEQIKGSGKKEPSQMLRLSTNEFGGSQDDWLLPYVQDFIHGGIDKSGGIPWTGVQDIQNTGLERMHGKMVPIGTRDAAMRDALSVFHASPVGQLHGRVRAAEGDNLARNLTEIDDTRADLQRNPHYVEARQFLNRPMGHGDQLPDDAASMWRVRPSALTSVFENSDLYQPHEVDDAIRLMDHWRDNPMQVPGHINFAAGGRVKSDLACKCGGHV